MTLSMLQCNSLPRPLVRTPSLCLREYTLRRVLGGVQQHACLVHVLYEHRESKALLVLVLQECCISCCVYSRAERYSVLLDYGYVFLEQSISGQAMR